MDAAHNLMQFINNFVLTDLSKNYEGLYIIIIVFTYYNLLVQRYVFFPRSYAREIIKLFKKQK